MLIIGSVQHKSCMHVLSGHTSTAEQDRCLNWLALLFRNAHAIAKADILDFDPMPAIHRWKGKCKRRRSFCSNSDVQTQS